MGYFFIKVILWTSVAFGEFVKLVDWMILVNFFVKICMFFPEKFQKISMNQKKITMQVLRTFRKNMNMKVLISVCIFMLVMYISATDFINTEHGKYTTNINNSLKIHNINKSYIQKYNILEDSSVINNNIERKEKINTGSYKIDLKHKEEVNASENTRTSYGIDDHKLVVFYTPFFNIGWEPFLGNGSDLAAHRCPVDNCRFSFDASKASSADAVIFHADDFSIKDIPKSRDAKQYYIWFNMEAPGIQGLNGRKYYRQLLQGESLGSKSFFNWTFTYHQQSDLHMPYGYLKPKNEIEYTRKFLNGLDEDATLKSYLMAIQEAKSSPSVTLKYALGDNWQVFLDRPKVVAWMVSHCVTDSGRELYVSELQKYMNVDIYGGCGPLSCGSDHKDIYCYTDVLQPTYMFYLAFENNCCTDYITEKLWVPMRHGLVPVVYGCGNYSKFLPPGSYIDATNMEPEDLAYLLTKLSGDKEAYGMYHIWRKFWIVSDRPPLCELCEKLHHSDPLKPLMQKDLAHWWEALNHCTSHYAERRHPKLAYINDKLTDAMKNLRSLFG